MKKVLVIGATAVVAILASTMMPVSELMPAVETTDRDRLERFAAVHGMSCQWLTPTVFTYIKAGRPKLVPNVLCRLRDSYLNLDRLVVGRTLQQNFEADLIRYFSGRPILIGLRPANRDAPLTCFRPSEEVKWVQCFGDPKLGCLFAKCALGWAN